MPTADVHQALQQLFAELALGPEVRGGAFILNSGDPGLMRSLGRLSAAAASKAVDGGATIAAHAQHVRYGLSLMNRWATEGGNPFADAHWEEAWKLSQVDDATWAEIQRGLRDEVDRWNVALAKPRETQLVELSGMIGSVAHLAYHLGAIRQISKDARGPREGVYDGNSESPSP